MDNNSAIKAKEKLASGVFTPKMRELYMSDAECALQEKRYGELVSLWA